ncbi:MAG TPA: DUF559 domain-containing protein [Symbiobacteriaceae bacterium]|jgi:hypothetical protein
MGDMPAVTRSLETVKVRASGEDVAAAIADVARFINLWRRGRTQAYHGTFSIFGGDDPFGGYRRFGRLTWHEAVFSKWFPFMEVQVTFGTGRGGRARWGAPSYTADLVDRAEHKVWEIDGPSHRSQKSQVRDGLKDAFFASIGFEVIRVPNSLVERWAEAALVHVIEARAGRHPMDPVQLRRAAPLLDLIHEYRESNAELERIRVAREPLERTAPPLTDAQVEAVHAYMETWLDPPEWRVRALATRNRRKEARAAR